MFEVTKEGKVFLNGVEKKQHYHPKGYLRINFNNTKYYVHRLVAQKYLSNPNNLPEVNHKNGIKDDNRVENLEWVTSLGNRQHAIENNLWGKNILDKRKLTEEQVNEIKEKYQFKKYTQKKLAEEYNVTRTVIYKIIKNKSYQKKLTRV
jgi:hypothetical protein